MTSKRCGSSWAGSSSRWNVPRIAKVLVQFRSAASSLAVLLVAQGAIAAEPNGDSRPFVADPRISFVRDVDDDKRRSELVNTMDVTYGGMARVASGAVTLGQVLAELGEFVYESADYCCDHYGACECYQAYLGDVGIRVGC